MVGSKSNYAEAEVLDWLYNYSDSKTPLSSTLYFALYRAGLTDASDPSDATNEGYDPAPGTGGYTRIQVDPGGIRWELDEPDADTHRVRNLGQISFPQKSNSGTITVVGVALIAGGTATQGSGGNIIAYDTGLSISVDQFEQPQIPIAGYVHTEL